MMHPPMVEPRSIDTEVLRSDGFFVVERLGGLELDVLRAEADRLLGGDAAGARNALGKSALLRRIGEEGPERARSATRAGGRAAADEVLVPGARAPD